MNISMARVLFMKSEANSVYGLIGKKIKFDWKKKSNFLCVVFDVFLIRVKMMKTHNFDR